MSLVAATAAATPPKGGASVDWAAPAGPAARAAPAP
ncbi:hypothetical protein X152_01511, partial [Mycobacterium tuberculosis BTB09-157]